MKQYVQRICTLHWISQDRSTNHWGVTQRRAPRLPVEILHVFCGVPAPTMNRALALLVVVFSAASCLAAPYTPAPKVVINLDLPPEQRWVEVVTTYRDNFATFVKWLNDTIPVDVREALAPVLAKVEDHFPEPYSSELKGLAAIARKLGIGVDLGELTLLNLIYDITAGCTSIVAQDRDGAILHGRNLDYPLPGLREVTLQADFRKGNRTLYTGTVFAGYIGLLTGMRPGGWSVSVNQRNRDAKGGPIDNIIEGLFKGGQSLGFFVRSTLEGAADFQTALQTLQHTRLMAPVYLTVAGARAGEAAIITRDREGPADVWFITVPSMWFITQTNFDHWLPSGDTRCETANKEMSRMSLANVTLKGMFDVLGTVPVFNQGTQYTSLISPATSAYSTFVRWDAPQHVSYGAKSPHLWMEKLGMDPATRALREPLPWMPLKKYNN